MKMKGMWKYRRHDQGKEGGAQGERKNVKTKKGKKRKLRKTVDGWMITHASLEPQYRSGALRAALTASKGH